MNWFWLCLTVYLWAKCLLCWCSLFVKSPRRHYMLSQLHVLLDFIGKCAKHPASNMYVHKLHCKTQLQAGRISARTSSSNASRVTSTTSCYLLPAVVGSFVPATLTHQFDGKRRSAPPIGSAKSCANFGGAARNLASKRRPVRAAHETLRMLSSIQVVLECFFALFLTRYQRKRDIFCGPNSTMWCNKWPGRVLEIGSGSGCHVEYFAPNFPHLGRTYTEFWNEKRMSARHQLPNAINSELRKLQWQPSEYVQKGYESVLKEPGISL